MVKYSVNGQVWFGAIRKALKIVADECGLLIDG